MANVYVIDGVTYVEVEREAMVGDYVLGKSGLIRNVKEICDNGFLVLTVGGFYTRDYCTVLEPLEEPTVDGTQASPQVIDMLANLARRVTQLESQLRDTQRNVERQAEELENAKHRLSKHVDRFGAVEEKVEMLTEDVVTLDERSQILSAINKYYAEGSR